MQRTTQWFGKLGTSIICGTILLAAVATQAADPSGTWSWTMQGRNRGGDNAAPSTNAARKVTLTLKAEGDKLTGSVMTPSFGRRGGQAAPATPPAPVETKISDGKIKGDEISFNVSREFNGNTMTQKYSGKVEGDTIKGKITFQRNGEDQSRDWEAKREK